MKWLLLILLFLCIEIDNKGVTHKYPTDVECIAATLYSEANTEPLQGARAVLDVILARMQKTSQNACNVVLQPKQFSGMNAAKIQLVDGKMLTRYWILSTMKPVCKNCMYFHHVEVYPAWASKMKRVVKIYKHVFYEEKK